MATRVHLAKAATPEQLAWRQRISQHEGAVVAAFLAWIRELHASIGDMDVARAIVMRSASVLDHALQAVAFNPSLAPIAEEEATLEFARTVRQIAAALHISFDVRDPNFQRMVEQQQARLVREVTDETRRAIGNLISRAYRDGLHPDMVAGQIRESVGLTSRQAQAVLSYSEALSRQGVAPGTVADRAVRYARQMRRRRALTIGRTETARVATQARLVSYEQAADAGLFDRATAELEWSSVQEDPNEICAQLDGTSVPFGEDFDGLLPPAHPCCRCSVFLSL